MRSMRGAVSVVALAAAALSACSSNGSGTALATNSETTQTTTGVRVAQSSEWAAEGQVLRESKRKAVRPDGYEAVNLGDYAFQSQPIDITGEGDYTLLFGPVDKAFELPVGFAINTPDDSGFKTSIGSWELVSISGSRFVRGTAHITGDEVAPYAGWSAWIS